MPGHSAMPDDSAKRDLLKGSHLTDISDETDSRGEDRRDKWGAFGYLSFAWVNRPITKARKEKLAIDELYLPQNATADNCFHEFDAEWRRKTAVPGESEARAAISSTGLPSAARPSTSASRGVSGESPAPMASAASCGST